MFITQFFCWKTYVINGRLLLEINLGITPSVDYYCDLRRKQKIMWQQPEIKLCNSLRSLIICNHENRTDHLGIENGSDCLFLYFPSLCNVLYEKSCIQRYCIIKVCICIWGYKQTQCLNDIHIN